MTIATFRKIYSIVCNEFFFYSYQQVLSHHLKGTNALLGAVYRGVKQWIKRDKISCPHREWYKDREILGRSENVAIKHLNMLHSIKYCSKLNKENPLWKKQERTQENWNISPAHRLGRSIPLIMEIILKAFTVPMQF